MDIVFGTDDKGRKVVKDITQYPVILIYGNRNSGKNKLIDSIISQADFPAVKVVSDGDMAEIKKTWEEIKRRYELLQVDADALSGMKRILLIVKDVERFGDSRTVTDILQRISVFGSKSGVSIIVSAAKATSINKSLRLVSNMKICGGTDSLAEERLMLDGMMNWYSELSPGEFIMYSNDSLTRFSLT